jgi:hypothetical protein
MSGIVGGGRFAACVLAGCLLSAALSGTRAEDTSRGTDGPITKEEMIAAFERDDAVRNRVVAGADLLSIATSTADRVRVEDSVIEGGLAFERQPGPITASEFAIVNSLIKAAPLSRALSTTYSFYAPATEFPPQVDFSASTFEGPVRLTDALFQKRVQFDGATFESGADLSNSMFNGAASFYEAKFNGSASFGGSRFAREASFAGAQFAEQAEFNAVSFGGKAEFYYSTFADDALFASVSFLDEVTFGGASIRHRAVFSSARFAALADFWAVQVGETLEASSTGFGSYVYLREASCMSRTSSSSATSISPMPASARPWSCASSPSRATPRSCARASRAAQAWRTSSSRARPTSPMRISAAWRPPGPSSSPMSRRPISASAGRSCRPSTSGSPTAARA